MTGQKIDGFFPFGRVFVQFFLRWLRLIFADGTLSGVIFKKKIWAAEEGFGGKKTFGGDQSFETEQGRLQVKFLILVPEAAWSSG